MTTRPLNGVKILRYSDQITIGVMTKNQLIKSPNPTSLTVFSGPMTCTFSA